MRHINLKCLIFVWSLPAIAQHYEVSDGDTIRVRIASREINRMLVDGGRINKVWGSSGILEIKPDKDNGEIYVKPTDNAKESFSFYIRDDQGATYTVVATQSDIASQTITVKPKFKIIRNSKSRTDPYILKIKKLIKEMALRKEKTEYRVGSHDKEVKLWKDVDIRLQRSYVSKDIRGEVYLIRNKTQKKMRFNESEFLGFGANVRAVSLDKLELEGEEAATLYVVRSGNG